MVDEYKVMGCKAGLIDRSDSSMVDEYLNRLRGEIIAELFRFLYGRWIPSIKGEEENRRACSDSSMVDEYMLPTEKQYGM